MIVGIVMVVGVVGYAIYYLAIQPKIPSINATKIPYYFPDPMTSSEY